MTSTSSSASNSQNYPRWNYDVFLSFRGEDTRKTFTGHLYKGLENRGLCTFQDDKRLEHGESISEALLKAIEESQVSIIIFSKNYATSRWCLNELVKIMECKDKNGQIVIPVFYDVDPSHVRKQTESFADAFAEHELKYKGDYEGLQKVQQWRTALTAAANLKGYDIRNRIESENIQEIVDDISKSCKSVDPLSSLQDFVGINTHLEKAKSVLEIERDDVVRIRGIWGMGGVGKTTIAKAIFDNLSWRFKAACFLEDVKEMAKKNQLFVLQNSLLSTLLGKEEKYVNSKHEGIQMIKRRLGSMKVLIVLDDIDHSDQLDYLAGDASWFGHGSRVVVTTRDQRLIDVRDAITYEVTTLPDLEAMQMFKRHAFRGEVPDEFKNLSLEVVNYAKGLPLALKVWGSMLYKRDRDGWTSAMEEMKNNSDSDIDKNLRISYDGLKDEEKSVFLDIACFFRGNGREYVMPILESCHRGAKNKLSILIEKALLSICKSDSFQMHDLIQDMAKNIVNMQKDAGKCSRIWDYKGFEDVMVKNKEAEAVEAIRLSYDLDRQSLCFSKEVMEKMKKLRMLCIGNTKIEYLPNNLRFFQYRCYRWESLPENFIHLHSLVHLELCSSSLRDLWSGTKHFPSLRYLNLSVSRYLVRTPDFKEMPNLEYLDMGNCERLEEVDDSLRYCGKLIQLYLDGCTSLKKFPCVNGESLECLGLNRCFSLEKFPEIIGTSKPKLDKPSGCFDLRYMRNLVSLPSSIGMFKDVVELDLYDCSKLESLPEEIGDLENLEILDAGLTLISEPPSSIVRLNKLKFLSFKKEIFEDGVSFVFPQVNEGLRSLENLDLTKCNIKDGGLPEDIGSLSSLTRLNLSGNNFEHLPPSISQLGALRYLQLSYCKRLKEFPPLAEGLLSLEILWLNNCNLIDGELSEDIGFLSSLKDLYLKGNNFEYLPRSIAQLGALRSLDLRDCDRLKKLPELPQQLDTINADWSNDLICNSLFQNISSLSLRRVFNGCIRDNYWPKAIPSWFDHQGEGTSVSVNLPKGWYVPNKFLGFAVCYCGPLIRITAQLIPLCETAAQYIMTQKDHSTIDDDSSLFLFLVPFAGLRDTCKAKGQIPNDYGHITLSFSGRTKRFGLRLLYKGEAEHEALLQMRKNNEPTEHGIMTKRSRYDDNEASSSSSKKQRPHSK